MGTGSTVQKQFKIIAINNLGFSFSSTFNRRLNLWYFTTTEDSCFQSGVGISYYKYSLKLDKNIWNNHFQHIGHEATKDGDPWDMGIKGSEPYNPQSYCQKRIFRHSCRDRVHGDWGAEGLRGRSGWSLQSRVSEKKELQRHLWRMTSNLHLRTDQHMWEKMTHNWGKKHPTRIRENNPWSAQWVGKSSSFIRHWCCLSSGEKLALN